MKTRMSMEKGFIVKHILNKNNILKKIKYLVISFSILFVSFFFVKLVYHHYKMITYPYLLEFREGAMLVSTDLLVKGRNPFSWDEQPEHMNMYGIVYSLAVYPLAKIFNTGPIVHRSVTAIFIWASCFLIGLVLYYKKVPLYYIFPASVLLYIFLLFPGTTTPFAGPHSLGLFLFLCSLFIPYFKKYSYPSLVISIILGILGFYTKAYYVLGLPYLTVYLFLFVSKKKGVLFGIAWGSVFLLSILGVREILECYFANTFFANLYSAQSSFAHCLKQFKFFFENTWGMFVILGAGIGIQISYYFGKGWDLSHFPKFNWKDFNKPILDVSVDLNTFCLILSTLLIYFKLGRHGGSWMGYLFQLMMPFLIILVFSIIKMDVWRLITIPFIGINIMLASAPHFQIHPEKSLKNWKTVEKIVSKYHNIYNSSTIVSILLEQNKEIYDSGLTESFHVGSAKGSFLKPLLLKEDRVEEKTRVYKQRIYDNIVHKKFDLLLITKNWFLTIPPAETQKNYRFIGSINLEMPYFPQGWELGIWEPKRL